MPGKGNEKKLMLSCPNCAVNLSVQVVGIRTGLYYNRSQLVTNCSQLKMQSADGKFYKTDVADTEQLFRLIQSEKSRTF